MMTGGIPTRASSPGNSDAGLLDVVANMLIVLILVTLAVLVVAAPPRDFGEIEGDAPPDFAAPVPRHADIRPIAGMWLVSGNGIMPLDLDETLAALADGANLVTTAIGSAQFSVLPAGFRDLNEYRLKFDLDQPAIDARDDLLPADAAASLIADQFANDGLHPVLVVLAGGHDSFAVLYHRLRSDGIALKWIGYQPRTGLTLLRDAATASTRLEAWQ